jgi:hypothetical protein
MKWINLSLALLLLTTSFGYGIGVGVYRWFPFDEIHALKDKLLPPEQSSISLPSEISTLNEELSAREGIQLRNKLLDSIVPVDQVNVSATSNAEFEVIETRYYGVNVRGELYKAPSSSSCLRIYVQGHRGNPNDFNYHNKLRRDFINQGCDVLSMSMLGLGLNIGEASFPTSFGTMILTEEQATHHGTYSFFLYNENPHLDALSLFLYPHMRLIEYAIKQDVYENVSIMGISGGGWYTVWLAALMPELDASVSYAGSLPFAYRNDLRYHGDWEDVYSPVYRLVSYFQLYQLMLLDEAGDQGRKAFLVYNDNDSCCFMDPAASDFQERVSGLGFYPQVILDESNQHTMNSSLVLRLLQND